MMLEIQARMVIKMGATPGVVTGAGAVRLAGLSQ